MTIDKKQFEFEVSGRILATDVDGNVEVANLTPDTDFVVINGLEIPAADIDSGLIDDLNAAILAIVSDYKSLS